MIEEEEDKCAVVPFLKPWGWDDWICMCGLQADTMMMIWTQRNYRRDEGEDGDWDWVGTVHTYTRDNPPPLSLSLGRRRCELLLHTKHLFCAAGCTVSAVACSVDVGSI